MKKIISMIIVLAMVFMVTSPAFAKKSGGFGGGFSRPKAPTTTTAPSTTTKDATSGSTSTGDKIPYTNLPSSKASSSTGAGATGAAGAAGAGLNTSRSNFSNFRPSFSPFSGNFWMWMFLMNAFGPSHSATAQTAPTGEAAPATTSGEEQQSGIYTPTMQDYWKADPMANTISTLLLLAVVALPIIWFVKRRKRLSH